MLSSTSKKLILIVFLVILAGFVSFPNELPNFKKPPIKFSLGKFQFERNYDLHFGLDLAGGSHLVFEADTSSVPTDKKKDAIESVKEVIERRVNLFGVSEPTVQTSSFEGKDRIVVELPGIENTKDAVDLIGKTAQLTFAEVVSASDSATLIPTELTGADLEKASVTYDQTTGKPAVGLEFTTEGGEKFANLTARNIGRELPIVLDNQVISAPVVQQEIVGGSAIINGNFTVDEAKNLSIQLNAGALPLSVKLIEERTVGASLGGDSINKSVFAGAIGLLMVMLFMILSYGKLGLIADVALIVFGILTLAIYKIIPVTLTLPGIAGFLLSVGMAVDSNILIFERFKEEKDKRSIENALEVSFGRAWDSIRDANIATLVTAFILANPFEWNFLHTSGPVRGFAITLTLGIAISLFTGVVVSRNLLRLFIGERRT